MANKILEFAPRLRSANFQPKLGGSAAQQEHIGEWQHVCLFFLWCPRWLNQKLIMTCNTHAKTWTCNSLCFSNAPGVVSLAKAFSVRHRHLCSVEGCTMVTSTSIRSNCRVNGLGVGDWDRNPMEHQKPAKSAGHGNFAPNDSSRNPSLQRTKTIPAPIAAFMSTMFRMKQSTVPQMKAKAWNADFLQKWRSVKKLRPFWDAQCTTFSHNKAILVSDKCEACPMEIQSHCPLVTVIQAAAKCRFLRPTLELKMDSSVVTVAFLVPASSIVVPPLTWFRKKHVEKTFSPC